MTRQATRCTIHPSRALLILACISGAGCAPTQQAQPDVVELRSGWDNTDELRFWLDVPENRAVVAKPMAIRLHVARREQGTTKPPRLLAGRFVFTFVSADARSGVSVHSIQESFSGAGGVDYTGKTALSVDVLAPSLPGRYWLHATVQSTPEDVRHFLMLAKVRGAAGPWWKGNRSTMPVQIEVVEAQR